MWTIDRLKRQALLWHLVFSLVLTIAIATWLLLHWFPAPFSFAAGALTGLIIVVSVDFCLGPMLTLLLIHSKKSRRENILDAVVIALLQLSALGYGLWQVSLARPVAIVFWEEAFYVVKAFDFKERLVQIPDFSSYSDESVPLIYARKPLLKNEIKQFENALKTGVVPYEQINLYRPLGEGLVEIRKSQLNIQILFKKHQELREQLYKMGLDSDIANLIFIKFYSEYGDFIIVLDRKGELKGLLKLFR